MAMELRGRRFVGSLALFAFVALTLVAESARGDGCIATVEFHPDDPRLRIASARIFGEEENFAEDQCFPELIPLSLTLDDVDDVVGICWSDPHCDAVWKSTGDFWTVTWRIVGDPATFNGKFINARGNRRDQIRHVDKVIYEPPSIDLTIGETRTIRIECEVQNAFGASVQADDIVTMPDCVTLPYFEVRITRFADRYNVQVDLPEIEPCAPPDLPPLQCTQPEPEPCACDVEAVIILQDSEITVLALPGHEPQNGMFAGDVRPVTIGAVDLDRVGIACGEADCDPQFAVVPFYDYVTVEWTIVSGGGYFLDPVNAQTPTRSLGATALYVADPNLSQAQTTVILRATVRDERAIGNSQPDRVFFDDPDAVYDVEFDVFREGVHDVSFVPFGETGPPEEHRLQLNANDAAHGGGHRFFPDARVDDVTAPNNRARVRVVLDQLRDDPIVYLKVFDVDDVSTLTTSHAEIDPGDDGATTYGGDNRGRLIDNGAQKLAWPATSIDPGTSGYHGQLRPILPDLPTPEFGITECVIGVPVRIENGEAFAEFELATTFAPGDNFRIFASTNRSAVEALVNPPTNDPASSFSGRATFPLHVWRRLHIEFDGMDPSGWYGDSRAVGVTRVTTVGTLVELETSWTDPNDPLVAIFENGVFELVLDDLLPYGHGKLSDHTYVGGYHRVLAEHPWEWQRSHDDRAAYTFGQDEFRIMPNGAGVLNRLVPKVDVSDDETPLQRLQSTQQRATNAFSDAFVEPGFLDDPSTGTLPAIPHMTEMFAAVMPYRASWTLERDVFWVGYFANAFEPPEDVDGDPNSEAAVPLEMDPVSMQLACIYLETLRDVGGHATHEDSADTYARAAVKALALQFQAQPIPGSLMADDFWSLPAPEARFAPDTINTIRKRVASPGPSPQ